MNASHKRLFNEEKARLISGFEKQMPGQEALTVALRRQLISGNLSLKPKAQILSVVKEALLDNCSWDNPRILLSDLVNEPKAWQAREQDQARLNRRIQESKMRFGARARVIWADAETGCDPKEDLGEALDKLQTAANDELSEIDSLIAFLTERRNKKVNKAK